MVGTDLAVDWDHDGIVSMLLDTLLQPAPVKDYATNASAKNSQGPLPGRLEQALGSRLFHNRLVS